MQGRHNPAIRSMALLRLPCSPSTSYFSTEHHPTFLRTSLSSSPHKSLAQLNYTLSTAYNFSISWSFPRSLFHTHTFPIRNSPFVLHVSSTTQDSSVVDSKTEDEVEQFSRTRLLAQNVPWASTHEDIRALFEKFGTVVEVELSMYNKTRNRGLAFVTMGSPEEALAALKGLESYDFEGRKLKMNYAKSKKIKPPPPSPPKPGPTFNLFVANLPFDARAKDLREFFIAEGSNVVSAEIIFNDNPRKSSGYGFVAFKSKKEADEALSAFQGKLFKGRLLRMARSRQFVRERRKEDLPSDYTPTELDSGVKQVGTAGDN